MVSSSGLEFLFSQLFCTEDIRRRRGVEEAPGVLNIKDVFRYVLPLKQITCFIFSSSNDLQHNKIRNFEILKWILER
jgi:hypothetical protein